MKNCLYSLELEIEQPVSLSARIEEVAWRWHARYGHLSFPALQKLHKEEMVHSFLAIKGMNRLCNGMSHRQAEVHSLCISGILPRR